MGLTVVRSIAAEREVVWAALTDVERWPDWSDSMTSVRRPDSGPFQVGSRARVKQPKLAAQVWQVTELTEGSGFTWEARSPGSAVIAGHSLDPGENGTTTLTLSLEQRGPLGAVLGVVLSGLTRRYVTMEADGLKRFVEKV
ncbi:SRPBCC family protein [Saccharomonospora sp. NPDC046836]|uniref:SRPBCC family protein n=1 Tax=Saccharomonospora sp. NPDC046836 TaxID=3156921 RepID=UPI0033EFDC4F